MILMILKLELPVLIAIDIFNMENNNKINYNERDNEICSDENKLLLVKKLIIIITLIKIVIIKEDLCQILFKIIIMK